MGRSRYKFGEAAYPHFLTCTVVGWLPVFTRPETVQIVFDSWQFLQDHNRMALLGYVVLENHIHFIASADDLASEVAHFKSYTARCIIDHLGERRAQTVLDGLEYHKARHKTDRQFQLWQEGSHPRTIETEAILRQKLAYIHDNPVRTRLRRRAGALAVLERPQLRKTAVAGVGDHGLARGGHEMKMTQSVEVGIPTPERGTE
jgi:putative transposase